jgi:UDP-N-acetylglucosamine 2-epimerase (non-hydrolysing)
MMNAGQSLNQLLIQGLSQLEQVFNDGKQRDAVIIQGDTTTVLAAGLVAFSMKIPVAHVEAGLRSYDLDHPFPEEGNRQLVSRITRWHFAPTEQSKQNLLLENIPSNAITVTGNTVVDAVYLGRDLIHQQDREHNPSATTRFKFSNQCSCDTHYGTSTRELWRRDSQYLSCG